MSSEPRSTVLKTERLHLRLADPDEPEDCSAIIRLYNDPHSGSGGNSMVNIKTPGDFKRKNQVLGAKPELCTLAPPPRGMTHLVFLPNEDDGVLIGFVSMSFRPEMPYPDIGYGFFGPYEGHGYASEAGRAVLDFWRNVIGVREIFIGTLEGNERSQRCAERIGFVRAGTFEVLFGHPPDHTRLEAVAFVLPGMEWNEGMVIRPTIGTGA